MRVYFLVSYSPHRGPGALGLSNATEALRRYRGRERIKSSGLWAHNRRARSRKK
jgi:hypothetical protein